MDCIYTPYLNQIQLILEELKPKIGEQTRELLSTKEVQEAQTLYKDSQLRRKMNQWEKFLNFSLIISREYLIKGLACYYSLEKQGKTLLFGFVVWMI